MRVLLVTIGSLNSAVFLNDRVIHEACCDPLDTSRLTDVRLIAENLASELGVPLKEHAFAGEPEDIRWQWADLLKRVPAEVSPTPSSADVAHWASYDEDSVVMTHQIDVADQRKQTGQLFIDIGSKEGMVDDMMCVTVEVHTNPLNGTDRVPCAHIHFDGDNLAVSLFKIGDRILARPETYVSIESFRQKVNDVEETFFWIDG